MTNGVFYRIKKDSNFTVVSNQVLHNNEISLKAKGLMALLLSLPEDWTFNKQGLLQFCTDGKKSLDSAINELKKHGYLEIKKEDQKKSKGKFIYTWHLHEEIEPYTHFGSTEKGSPYTLLPYTEKGGTNKILNNKIYKKGNPNPMELLIEEFSEYREDMGKPFNTKSLMYFKQALMNYSDGDVEVAKKIIQQAMIGGYQSIQPLKEYKQSTRKKETLKSEEEYSTGLTPEEIEKLMSD